MKYEVLILILFLDFYSDTNTTDTEFSAYRYRCSISTQPGMDLWTPLDLWIWQEIPTFYFGVFFVAAADNTALPKEDVKKR